MAVFKRDLAREAAASTASTGEPTVIANLPGYASLSADNVFTGTQTATGFVGPLTGDVTGNVTGNLSGVASQANVLITSGHTFAWDIAGKWYTTDPLRVGGAVTLDTALTVPNGGTGATTLTGIVKGNGTSAFTAATGADVATLVAGQNVTLGTVTSPSVDYENNPASHGLLAWTYPVSQQVTITPLTRDGYILLGKIWVPNTITVTGIEAYCAATLLTNADNFNGFALYSSGGVLIAKSADQATTWASGTNSLKSATLTAESGQSLTIAGGAGVYVYGAILANTNGGTTPAWAYQTTGWPLVNAGLVGTAGASTLKAAYVSGQTAFPSLTATAFTGDNYAVWMALY